MLDRSDRHFCDGCSRRLETGDAVIAMARVRRVVNARGEKTDLVWCTRFLELADPCHEVLL